jgi:Vam6/Vps39-like protein vacuolar protein sorting-associated protein 39
LLVGLNTGCLRIYRVNELSDDQVKQNGSAKADDIHNSRPEPSATTKPVDLLREVEKFSSKPIEQLAIIKEANILVSLSNSFISIHDLHSYTLQEQLSKTKSTTSFAVTSNIIHDSTTGIPEIISRLAVAVKRRLLLWSWHESELSPDVTEITLAASIRTVVWASATKVICGMNSGYAIVDVISHDVEDIVGPGAIGTAGAEGSRFGGVGSASMGYMGLGGYTPKPLITRLGDGEMLLAKDVNSVFIDSDGKPLEKRQIPWQQAPDSIGYSYPYLLALQPASKGALEVRNPETLALLQTISVPNASQMHFPPPTVSLAHAGKGFHVASDRSIWRMGATDYDTQIDELVDKAQYDEALSLLNMLEDALLRNKGEREREIKMLKAQLLFSQRKYRGSLELYTSALAPPRRVISLYPRVIAGDLAISDGKDNPESGAEESGKQNGVGNGLHSTETAIPDTAVGSPIPAALSKILKQHKKAVSDTGSIKSFIRGDADGSDTASLRAKPMDDGALEGKDLINAVRELSSFLVDTRATRVQLCLDPISGKLKPPDDDPIRKEEQRKKRDTLQEEPLPDGDPKLEAQLQEIAKIVDTTLFRAYMLATPQNIGPLSRVPNFCDPDVVNEKLLENGQFNDLVEFFHGKKLHRHALELLKKFGEAQEGDQATTTLRGPQRTVGYLQNLPPSMIDLILEFVEWPLRADPDVGMEVFLADTENAETLPRERVVTFLQGIDVDLAIKYVEHLINELSDPSPDFHNWLVGAYVEKLKCQSDRDEAWNSLMGKLLSFLRKSKQYSLSKAFGLIPRDGKYCFDPRGMYEF